jgi:uncharacterized protein (DUF2384 family)
VETWLLPGRFPSAGEYHLVSRQAYNGNAMEKDSEAVDTDSIDALIEHAIDVIGDREEALRWMGTPVQDLGYATPIACMGRSGGRDLVFMTLERLRYGVW